MAGTILKDRIADLLDRLPDTKVEAVLDFVEFLAERETPGEWFHASSQSSAYREWVSAENDVYDEVFADVAPTR